jgi:LPXTG-motif cell wall-anchored protein
MNFMNKRMQTTWVGLLVVSFIVSALLLFPSRVMAQESVTVQLDSMNGSRVTGTATLRVANGGTDITLAIEGLMPSTTARATLQAGTCAQPSASAAALPELQADATGRATATGAVLFRGTEPVALATIADGAHILAIQTEQVVACGVIPNLTAASSPPAQLPVTGGAASANLLVSMGVLALSAVLAALFLWRRNRPLGHF